MDLKGKDRILVLKIPMSREEVSAIVVTMGNLKEGGSIWFIFKYSVSFFLYSLSHVRLL